jgi:hypothetical protein
MINKVKKYIKNNKFIQILLTILIMQYIVFPGLTAKSNILNAIALSICVYIVYYVTREVWIWIHEDETNTIQRIAESNRKEIVQQVWDDMHNNGHLSYNDFESYYEDVHSKK